MGFRGLPAELVELLDDRHRPAWMAQAACRGMSSSHFYSDKAGPGRPAHALVASGKAVCETCSVRAPCLEYGLHERFGVWGGLNDKERRALRRSRRCCA